MTLLLHNRAVSMGKKLALLEGVASRSEHRRNRIRKRMHCQEGAKYVPCDEVNLVTCPKWTLAGNLSNEAPANAAQVQGTTLTSRLVRILDD